MHVLFLYRPLRICQHPNQILYAISKLHLFAIYHLICTQISNYLFPIVPHLPLLLYQLFSLILRPSHLFIYFTYMVKPYFLFVFLYFNVLFELKNAFNCALLFCRWFWLLLIPLLLLNQILNFLKLILIISGSFH